MYSLLTRSSSFQEIGEWQGKKTQGKILDSHTATGRDEKKAGGSTTNEIVTLDYIDEATEK
ncbi:hypothetical protein H5410_046520 [Solanum commersonii]|uniref:Uncharacterized protein n=1 Tax=Solanum commersonii TaxID=4109 RepID=A0A9J5XFW9_SOLCO|nr:hypothetical protein H5410_046520 [Solanum commersonii]